MVVLPNDQLWYLAPGATMNVPDHYYVVWETFTKEFGLVALLRRKADRVS